MGTMWLIVHSCLNHPFTGGDSKSSSEKVEDMEQPVLRQILKSVLLQRCTLQAVEYTFASEGAKVPKSSQRSGSPDGCFANSVGFAKLEQVNQMSGGLDGFRVMPNRSSN